MKQKNNVRFGRIKKAVICIGLVMFLVGMAIPCDFALGQGRRVKPEMVFPDHYPYGFDGMGYLQDLSTNEIVINDKGFKLSHDVTYHTLEVEHASRGFFHTGHRVGYLLNSKREIKSLWLIK